MNIVYENKKLFPVKMQENKQYSIDDLVFYIPKNLSDKKIFLIIGDGKDFDAVELKQTNSTSKSYYNYICKMNNVIKVRSGICTFSLIGINKENFQIEFNSSPLSISLENELYNFKVRTSLLEETSKKISDTYKEIATIYNNMISLTRLNIETMSVSGEEAKNN